MFKLLIDECLSPDLVDMARGSGHHQSNPVSWLGKSGTKDPNLMKIVISGDWTLVTNNSHDFRGHAKNPGKKGLYSRQAIHAGLICLNWPSSLASLEMHRISFQAALDDLKNRTELINKCLKINASADGDEIVIEIVEYEIPV